MAYKLQVVEPKNSLNFNVRYENLARAKRPKITAKAPNGKEVQERLCFQGQVLMPGTTQRQWVDDSGQIYSKSELTFYCDGEQVEENQQTKVFSVEGYQSEAYYTDRYVIATYYELYPDDNGMKKDFDKQIAVAANLSQMRKLWKYLHENKVVARGEFVTSSRGFVASDGYIRAILVDGNKWGLEVGVFKEEKLFHHLNEGEPKEVSPLPVKQGKRIKRI